MQDQDHHLSTVASIDQYLPQTQCTKCGYPRCKDYAKAMYAQEADINRCPPGGEFTIQALARLLHKKEKNLADDCERHPGRYFARIQERNCIGCTLCIEPCPTDAIIGTAKHMHSVLVQECTGCQICLEYCPVDCIKMIKYPKPLKGALWSEYGDEEVARWRRMTERRIHRKASLRSTNTVGSSSSELKSEIRDAVNRERSKRWKRHKRNSSLQNSRDSAR